MKPFRTRTTQRTILAILRTVVVVVVSGLAWPLGAFAQPAVGTPAGVQRPAGGAPTADDWPQWTTGRYRLTPGDVIQLTFPYVSEFDQTITVQPDGYVSLRSVRDLYAQGLTMPQFERALVEAYTSVLRDPVVSLSLKEFEKPYFIAAGEVAHPGKFDLRGATTVTQALAIAGGTTKSAKSSQIILFRRFTDELLEVKTINARKMMRARDLSEDAVLRPGDTLFVPTSALSQLGNFIAKPALGLYLDPLRQIP
jgi:polysaccharide export outer membrane protein